MELSVHIENKIKKSLNTVNSNIESSKGLPNKFYTSEEIFEYEKETVFSDNWCGITFGSDIPDVGDIKALEFLSIPLIVVRTEKEQIQVFENVCRHRGMILVKESVTKKNVSGALIIIGVMGLMENYSLRHMWVELVIIIMRALKKMISD
tara:strand:- start:8827 stop:9276 length:450 start_codon:yes stop_codon:yes gene_type:complete